MRRVPCTSRPARSRRGPVRLLSRWITALLITAAVALLAPGVSYAAAAQPGSAQPAAFVGCMGITPAAFPATGFIADPARDQGGHFWWRGQADGGICIGTVVEFVRYASTATKTWRVIVYDTQHPGGKVAARQTFTLARGWYFWAFPVHQVYQGLQAVCVTADESFGTSCVHFGPAQD